MSFDAQTLYELLPAIYRIRDVERGTPLRQFLEVIASEVGILEENLAQLYDDQFIETCAEWAVPYIGDLVSARPLHHLSSRVASPRALVANTLRYRRRKGTASALEGLARDATSWPAKAVEFFQTLATTQFMNHVRPQNLLAPDLRARGALEAIDTAFNQASHSVDTRSIGSGEGKFNIPNVGIFLWRLAPQPFTDTPAVRVDNLRYRFHPLGRDLPLFFNPAPLADAFARVTLTDVPDRITRWFLHTHLEACFGPGKSINIQGVNISDVVAADLSDAAGGWAHAAPAGKVAIDPVLGRIAFSTTPAQPVIVSFNSAFSADLGGGEYDRELAAAGNLQSVSSGGPVTKIQDAIDQRNGVDPIEITDSGLYAETLTIQLQPGEQLILRAANRCRPHVALSGDWVISGGDANSRIVLDGLLVSGGSIRVKTPGLHVQLRDCAVTPGITLNPDGSPVSPDKPTLVIEKGGVTAEITSCIVGSVHFHAESTLRIQRSIVDATRPQGIALAAAEGVAANALPPSGGTLSIEDSTVFGKVKVRVLELASNTVFHSDASQPGDAWPAPVWAERKQIGCVRFSFVPDGSRTPQRYRCQPNLEIGNRTEAEIKELGRALTPAERAALRTSVISEIKPAFTSTRFGDAAYAQLRRRAPAQLRQGADNESEMGVFNSLLAPQREINLRVRLDEYLRISLEAGIFYVT